MQLENHLDHILGLQIHENLHGGNVLVAIVDDCFLDAIIVDVGLQSLYNVPSQETYGLYLSLLWKSLMENLIRHLKSGNYDVGIHPYWDRPHDFDISSELRLGVVHGTLLVFAKLTFWMLVHLKKVIKIS